MIAIVDYGVGNLFSLSSSLKALGLETVITNNADQLRAADRIILPGVGAFGDARAKLDATGLVPVIREEEDQIYVLYQELRGYVKLSDAEVIDPVEGEILHGTISVNGNTSGRATVKLRYGPSVKEKVMQTWKTGTKAILIRQENDFWLIEAKGLRLWVHKDYITEGE